MEEFKKQLFLLLFVVAGCGAAWAQENVTWVKVTDYSTLSTNDTYVIAGSGVSGGTTIWYSLKNNQITKSDIKSSTKGLSIGQSLTIEEGRIASSISDDETWKIELSDTDGEYYIKSTKATITFNIMMEPIA